MTTAISIHETQSSLMPSPSEWAAIKEQASMAVKSGFLPASVNTPEKAVVIALKGRELGIPMMQAFAHIHVIQGKPAISSELMLSLIYRNCKGALVDYEESTDQKCVIVAKRPGHKAAKFSFGIEDAKKAGLLSKQSWATYPSAMLRARTIAIVARAVFADAIMGASYTPEELGAEVDDEENVIDAEHRPASTPQLAPVPIQPEKPTEPKTQSRDDLGREIVRVAKQIKLTPKDMADWVQDVFKKDMKSLTIAEMQQFLETLQRELGRTGDLG